MSEHAATEHLVLGLSGAEGALVRTLGMIERRGWRFASVRCATAGETGFTLRLDVASRDPARSALVLKRQLERLADVTSIDIAPSTGTTEETAS